MIRLVDVIESMRADKQVEVQEAINHLYEVLSGNEAKMYGDSIKYTKWVIGELPQWLKLLEKEVELNENGALILKRGSKELGG